MNFKAIRSSGAGGQHVNKVSSKMVLNFNLNTSQSITDEERLILVSKLKSKLTLDNNLILTCDEDRSQFKNKRLVTKRFLEMIEKALIVPKKRKPTQIPKAVIENRLKNKATISEIKNNRKKPEL